MRRNHFARECWQRPGVSMRAMQARLLWQMEALGSRDEGGNLASPLELRTGLDCQRLVLDVTFHMR